MKYYPTQAAKRLAITIAFAVALMVSSTSLVSAAPAGGAASSTPKSIVTSFYRAISNWNFGNAYMYIYPKGRPTNFYTWAHGFTTTKKVTITTLKDPGYRITTANGRYTCVGVRFTSTYYTTSQTSTYGGWYMTRFSSNVHWRIYLPGSSIVLNGKPITPNKATCTAHIK